MESPYVNERQVEYWTSRGIESFFTDSGLEIQTFPISQLNERHFPSDFLYLDSQSNKLFGFQYKVLYRNKTDHWNLDRNQHAQLANFDWMYYALSDLRNMDQQRNSLFYLRVTGTNFPFHQHMSPGQLQGMGYPRYFRWATFFEGLRSCRYGRLIRGRQQLRRALWPHADSAMPRELRQIANEILVANFRAGRAVKFSSTLAADDT